MTPQQDKSDDFPQIPLGMRIKLLGLVFGTIPIALYSGWTDLRYFARGQTTKASVLAAARTDPPRDKSVIVQYSFEDPTLGVRSEKDNLAATWDVPGESIEVEYIPGVAGMSRVKGQLTFFLYFLMLLGIVAVILACAFCVISLQELREARTSHTAITDGSHRQV